MTVCSVGVVDACMWLQALGETGTVLSEDGDSDVRVAVCGCVWTFNVACLAPAGRTATDDKTGELSTDDDDDDDDEQETIGM